MEVQTKNRQFFSNNFFIALIFIAVGLLLIARNFGYIAEPLLRVFISWQMLLIVIGTISLLRRHTTGGAVMIVLGVFFLIPKLPGIGHLWMSNFWPLIFIAVGLIIFFRRSDYENQKRWDDFRHNKMENSSFEIKDGFITSHNSFGSVQQVVLDPVFKGGFIRNSFGSTVIDLRRTTLEQGETYLDFDCSFGGIELHVPESWTVKSTIKNSFSGFADKRYRNMSCDPSKVLVLRGSISFSGVEVKD